VSFFRFNAPSRQPATEFYPRPHKSKLRTPNLFQIDFNITLPRINEPLQKLQAEMTSSTLSTRYELMVHQTVDVKVHAYSSPEARTEPILKKFGIATRVLYADQIEIYHLF
jgi:hypothetical protein